MAPSSYYYHGTGHALSGRLTRPVQYLIGKQAESSLPSTGGEQREQIEDYRLESFISFRKGYTHVLGEEKIEDAKTINQGFATAVVEGLNILDMVTADRIVARVSFHGESGEEPRVLLLGSTFQNLRIAGYPVDVQLDHELGMQLGTFDDVRQAFAKNLDFRRMAEDPYHSRERRKEIEPDGSLLSSLIRRISTDSPGVRLNGHVLSVPDFGKIYLAEVLFERGSKTLTMVRIELGSPVAGRLLGGVAGVGGSSQPFRRPGLAFTPPEPAKQVQLPKSLESIIGVENRLRRETESGAPSQPRIHSPRYANAALFEPSSMQPLDPGSSLRPGNIVRLRLDIGPLSLESQIANARPLPEDKLPPDIDLDVMVSSTDFEVASDVRGFMKKLGNVAHGRFFLPSSGEPATTPEGGRYLIFHVYPPESLEQGRLRIGYYYRNILVQSQQLVANVLRPGGFTIQTDFTLSDDLTNLQNFPERPRISILTNANGDGTHQIVLRQHDAKSDPAELGKTFAVREKNVGAIIKQVRAILRDRASAERQRSPEMLREDLKQLAPKGRDLWRQLPGQHPQVFAPLDEDPASHVIQVSRPTTSGFVFPWALIYDIPLNSESPAVCDLVATWDGKKPLVTGTPRECPHGPHIENVLCPFGFWGFRYSIDQLTSTEDSVFRISVPDAWDFVVAETQYDVDLKALSSHVDELRKTLGKRFPGAKLREGKTKQEIRDLLGSDLPVVYFYCHGERPNVEADTYLGVGKRESIKATEMQDWVQSWSKQKKAIWKKIRPLVFVNACHSLEIYPDTLVSYLEAFVGTACAAGVIGTEVRVSQKLAMDVAGKFFDLLLGEWNYVDGKQKPYTVDEALRAIRFDYLSAGNLLGLVYTPYCWSELSVTLQQPELFPQ